MRRLLLIRDERSAMVAVYDALLFLMVAILISSGMFLYSATAIQEGGGLSDAAYQRICDNQRKMVEGLATNESHPSLVLEWSNGTDSRYESLLNLTGPTDVETVRWMLESYCKLTWENDHIKNQSEGTWDTNPIVHRVGSMFKENGLNGTEGAWLFLYEGSVEFFGSSSDSISSAIDLPNDRWASSRDYSFSNTTVDWSAELRYFLWIP